MSIVKTINITKRALSLEKLIITCTGGSISTYSGNKLVEGLLTAKSINIKEFQFTFLDGKQYQNSGRVIRQSPDISPSLINDLTSIITGNYISV